MPQTWHASSGATLGIWRPGIQGGISGELRACAEAWQDGAGWLVHR